MSSRLVPLAFSLVLLFTLLPSAAVQAAPEAYTIDRSHTHAGFKVRHNMVSWVHGSFGKVEGTVVYDPDDVSKTSIEVTIDVSSIDTANEKRDKHLRDPDFFDVEKFPTAVYKSSSVRNVADDGSFEVVGELTLHGVTKEVVLKVDSMSERIQTKRGGKRGASATGKINRQDFGISWSRLLDNGGLAVGNEVQLLIEVELNEITEE